MALVVARYSNGDVLKGSTADFTSSKDHFHLVVTDARGAQTLEIQISDLKALFFVKDLAGDLGHAKSNIFDPKDMTIGRKIRVVFHDGEIILGFSQTYSPGRPAFFLQPADRRSNAERVFIVTAATREVAILEPDAQASPQAEWFWELQSDL